MSEKPDEKERLKHIIDAINRINRFTENVSFAQFKEDEIMQFALIKNFEIIGEAAYHLSPNFRQNHAEIEWRKIIVFRHILVHDYYKINVEFVWNAKENKINELKKQIEQILNNG